MFADSFLILLLLSACSGAALPIAPSLPAVDSVISSPDVADTMAPTFKPTVTELAPTASSTAPDSPTPAATFLVCTPLQGIPIEQIAAAVTNPYDPPPPGSDDPHAGIDISDLLPGSQMARPGMPIQAVLPGRVALAQTDRFPFGSAILIETPLDQLPQAWVEGLHLPAPLTGAPPKSALTCPEGVLSPSWDTSRRSLYVLYAHLQDAPEVKPGETMACGQVIGKVGQSGNALNPHLHLEARVGLAGARFTSIAHYDNSATLEEMASYCAWSVSGQFQVIDPLILLK